MKILAFQCARFSWSPASQTLPGAASAADVAAGEVDNCLVAFIHIEAEDQPDDRRKRAFRHAIKHLKWLANKRKIRHIVLHSFAHLGGTNAEPAFARQLLVDLAERLETTGYKVWQTPFGWFCGWNLDVHGDSLAKVYKQI